MNKGIGPGTVLKMMAWAIACVFIQGGLQARQVVTFELLGIPRPPSELANPIYASWASGVSADGSIVVGNYFSGEGAAMGFRWEGDVMTYLSSYGFSQPFEVTAVSADGSVIVGGYGQRGFLLQSGEITYIGSAITGVSADGTVVVGYSANAKFNGFRWEEGNMINLYNFPKHSFAFDISGDGSEIAGVYEPSSGSLLHACVWVDEILSDLGDIPGGTDGSEAHAISADGSTIVGLGNSLDGKHAVRWQGGNIFALESNPSNDDTYPVASLASDVSGDGKVVVGTDVVLGAVYWAEADAWSRIVLNEFLDAHDVDRNGFNLKSASAISVDASTIVGDGLHPNGEREAFRIQILDMWGQYRIKGGYADTTPWMGRLHVANDPWVWCGAVPCWFNIPEETVNSEHGWVYPPEQDKLQIVQVDGTDWGYSFALKKWMYLTDSEWMYMP